MAPEACPASAHVPSDDTTRLAQQLTGLRRALSQYANSLHVCDVGPCTTRHRHENEARIAYRAIKSLLATLRRAIALRETVEANDYLRALEAPVDTTSGASSTSDEDPPRRYMYRSDLGFDDELDPAPETAEEDDEDDDIRQWGDFS
nr:hypothetical protein B0A51_15627 [Rachicladosporium sp. CCFEE 5018]